MLLSYIRSNKASYILVIIFTGILLWTQTFLSNKIAGFSFDNQVMPLFYFINYYLESYPILHNLLGLLTVFVISFMIMRLNEKHIIIETRSHLISLLIIMLISSVQPLTRLHPGIFAALFLIIVFDKIFDAYKNDSQFSNYFDAGFLISISSLFYFNTIFLMLALWICMLFLNAFSIRNLVLSFLGLLAPYFLTWTYFYYNNDVAWFISAIENNFLNNADYNFLHLGNYILFAFLGVLIVFANFKVINSLRTSKISTRKFLRTIFIFLIFILSIEIFIPSTSLETLPLLAIPISFFLSYFFLNIKNNWFGQMLVVIFIVLIIFEQLYPVLSNHFFSTNSD